MTDNGAENKADSKPRRRGRRPSPTGLEFAAVVEATPLEKESRTRATEQLRMALAPHQQVVKLLVADRLTRRPSFQALAKRYGLTVEDVADILQKMRGWVAKYTTYYQDDWYWVDGARPKVRGLASGAPAGSPAGSPAGAPA